MNVPNLFLFTIFIASYSFLKLLTVIACNNVTSVKNSTRFSVQQNSVVLRYITVASSDITSIVIVKTIFFIVFLPTFHFSPVLTVHKYLLSRLTVYRYLSTGLQAIKKPLRYLQGLLSSLTIYIYLSTSSYFRLFVSLQQAESNAVANIPSIFGRFTVASFEPPPYASVQM